MLSYLRSHIHFKHTAPYSCTQQTYIVSRCLLLIFHLLLMMLLLLLAAALLYPLLLLLVVASKQVSSFDEFLLLFSLAAAGCLLLVCFRLLQRQRRLLLAFNPHLRQMAILGCCWLLLLLTLLSTLHLVHNTVEYFYCSCHLSLKCTRRHRKLDKLQTTACVTLCLTPSIVSSRS